MRAWVIRCDACQVDSIYDDIPEDIESFFLPKAPEFSGGRSEADVSGVQQHRELPTERAEVW